MNKYIAICSMMAAVHGVDCVRGFVVCTTQQGDLLLKPVELRATEASEAQGPFSKIPKVKGSQAEN